MIEKIINEIKKTVKPISEQWEKDFLFFINKLQQYCMFGVYKDSEYLKVKEQKIGIYSLLSLTTRLKENQGYKKSFERFIGRSEKNLIEIIKKEAQAKLLKIDIAVEKKLSKFKNPSIKLIQACQSFDGYIEGSWEINNTHILSFKVIYAGGYNIQCLHYRTIYNLKNIK